MKSRPGNELLKGCKVVLADIELVRCGAFDDVERFVSGGCSFDHPTPHGVMVNAESASSLRQTDIARPVLGLTECDRPGGFSRRPFNETVRGSFDGLLADKEPVCRGKVIALQRSPADFGFVLDPVEERCSMGLC